MASKKSPKWPGRVRALPVLPTVAVAISLIALVTVLFRLRGTESLDSALNRCHDAVLAGDARILMRYMPEREKRKLGWSERDLRAYLDWANAGLLDMRPASRQVGELAAHGDVGSREWFFRGPDGRQTSLVLNGFQGENGPEVFLSMDLLLTTAQARYLHRMDRGSRTRRLWAALDKCLKEEGPTLESLGLKGVANSGPKAEFMSWRSIRAAAARVMAREDAKEAGVPAVATGSPP